jgi:HNH endonuclease
MCHSGGSHLILRKYAAIWEIPTSHFDPYARAWTKPNTPLEEILVAGSTFSRGHLKRRLLRAGLKQPICEICGQGELWQGCRMSLVLDHINGVRDDHRLENLRILCPNCNATLDTHCGRNKPREIPARECLRCGGQFVPGADSQRYCSRACGAGGDRAPHPRPESRRVERPPYQQLLAELAATSFSAVGRKYGVSDNAIRKWVCAYEREQAYERERAPPLAA